MRWQKKRWSSNSTLRSIDNSGILQCFRGTTVCAASGGLDMHVPEPFLQTKQSLWLQRLLQGEVLPAAWMKRKYIFTLYETSPPWRGSWSSGSHCWPNPVRRWVAVCSTWFGSPLSFHQPWQTPTARLSLLCLSRCAITLYNVAPVCNKRAAQTHWDVMWIT